MERRASRRRESEAEPWQLPRFRLSVNFSSWSEATQQALTQVQTRARAWAWAQAEAPAPTSTYPPATFPNYNYNATHSPPSAPPSSFLAVPHRPYQQQHWPLPGGPLSPQPSYASFLTADSAGSPAYGGSIPTKPSYASIPESTRGLLGASAPIAGFSVTAKPSLASLPEAPRQPGQPGQQPPPSWPLPPVPPVPVPAVPQPVQQPVIPFQQPAVPFQQPAVPFQQPAVPFQQPTVPFQQPVAPFQQPAAPFQQPTVPFQQPVAPFQQPAAPFQQPAAAAGAGTFKPPEAPKTWRTDPLSKKDQYKKRFFTFVRIFSYSTWKERVYLGLAALAAMGAGCTLPIVNIIFGRLVTTVTSFTAEDLMSANAQKKFTDAVNECVLFMVYLFVGRFMFGYCATIGFRMASIRISSAMRLAYMKAVLDQPISGLDAIPAGRTAAVITNTANTMQLGIGEKLGNFVMGISLILSALAIAFFHNWKLTLVTSSGLVLISVTYAATIPMVVRKMKEVEDADIKASAVSGEAFATIRMIAACGAETKMGKRYSYWVKESERRGLRMTKFVSVQQAVVFFTVYGTFALTFWFAIRLYLNFEIPNVGTLIIVLMSIMMIVMSIGNISQPISAAARSSSAASILFNMIDLPTRKVDGKKEPDVSADGDIVLQNVNFTYPARPDTKVLFGLNVRFPAGKLTAIVGPSGSGKSTIVGLIERWYELDGDWSANLSTLLFRNGQITCGGVPLKDMDLKWWRSQIGLVQQEPFLFNDTIQKNVEHGLIGTPWEHESRRTKKVLVERACMEAFADEFISRLPEGLKTRVGDSGIKLSGGQRQRIAIARAIVKQPKILILDEATSAIDVRGEQMVQAALDRVSKNRTTITIAHRLSTIKKADNIVVLTKGKAVQQGTHDSLMAQVGGAYWTLATSQQLSMDEEAPDSPDLGEKQRSIDLGGSEENWSGVAPRSRAEEAPYVQRGLFRSFGTLIVEQGRLWPWYVVLIFGAIIAGGCNPVQAYLFAQLISGFYLWGETLRTWINFWCLMFTALASAVGLGYFALAWAATTLAFHITAAYRQEYFENTISKPVSFYDDEKHSVGGLTAVMASDPTQLQQLLGTNMGFALISVLSVVGCLTISFYFGWKLTLIALCSSLPIVLAAGFFRIRYETKFEAMNKLVFAESAKFATEAVGACRTVTALTMEASILKRYDRLLRHHVEEGFEKAKFSTIAFAASDSMPLLCMAFVLWYGGKLLANQEYTPFQYLVVYIAVVQGGIGAGQWLSFAPNIAQATAAANRILSMRKREKRKGQSLPVAEYEHAEYVNHSKGGEVDEKGVELEFSNVWFRYPTRDVPVLNGLNLTIKRGQFVAIVGASGAGKTSIISLLERFYTVRAGTITLNGVDINDIDLAEYRRSISLVAQEASLFTGSIRENILAGVDESIVSEDALHQVCRDAEIHDFIISLPDGYDTRVGLRGVLLSGGQRQRIAIARALIRRPRLLLLDEATASLDSETEKAVQKVFERTKKERTMVVVAHRLATVQNADIIYVLGDGQVLESGNHATLLGKRGTYYHMCLSQALDR